MQHFSKRERAGEKTEAAESQEKNVDCKKLTQQGDTLASKDYFKRKVAQASQGKIKKNRKPGKN